MKELRPKSSKLRDPDSAGTRRISQPAARKLLPIRPIWYLGNGGLSEIPVAEITAERVGWKAFGLSAIPEVWTSPCFLIGHDLAKSISQSADTPALISACLGNLGIAEQAPLLIRSSGTNETMKERGRLYSRRCTCANAPATVAELVAKTETTAAGPVHWIVQEYHEPRVCGHFSNERRIRYEKRDWIAEVEPHDGRPGYVSPVAVRKWRDGVGQSIGPLNCSSEASTTVCLKQVAMWAIQFTHRMHFEWLWDGRRVVLVQADAENVAGGIRPPDALPSAIPVVNVGQLEVFQTAKAKDYADFKKLRNAALYGDLGYAMPPFYVLRDPHLIKSILDGDLPLSVGRDLSALTARPLIIRTDGSNIPSDKREMLPRSDELRSAAEARTWIMSFFRDKILKNDLRDASLVLIAHHFIPAIASAWARGEPGRPVVRVEALWGIPEGLYWFSHDTFEVDTQNKVPLSNDKYSGLLFPYAKKLRFKGTFWAPDSSGRWLACKSAYPFDWKATIDKVAWLSEIAWVTKQVAEREKEPVSVMWFIGGHPEATKHSVLPWFHSRSDFGDAPKAAPRRKFRASSDFKIETTDDWNDFQKQVALGKHIERVVVEPLDPSLIREPLFAKALAELAKSKGIVVELSGGVLSHVYYILQRAGARVECVDLFGDEFEILEFNKVVRDKVPEVIAQKGERAETLRLSGDALVLALKQKLVEEALEALDAVSGEELIGELADVAEVIQGLSKALGIGMDRIEGDRLDKYKKRGGFDGGYLLTKTAASQSLISTGKSGANANLKTVDAEPRVISDPARLPSRSTYRRPDLRQPEESEIEKLLTIETEINRDLELKESLEFSFPEAGGVGHQQFVLVLELKRSRASLRAVVRLRRTATQLHLTFDDRQLPLFQSS